MKLDKLPDSLILNVYYYLTPFDVAKAGQCCRALRRVAHDDLLWKYFFHHYFRITPHFREPLGGNLWRSEFIRLLDGTALVESEVITKHTDQVLHVSFSHDGQRFATTGKDAMVYVWKSTYPTTLEYSYSMRKFSWKYTQFSQFNESDTLLLVSGVLFGLQSTAGEIIVFSVNDGFHVQCRIINKPYDIFGAWYSDRFLMSGDLKWLGNLVSKSVIWLNKASLDIESECAAIMNQMYRFYNPKASSVRSILVANCVDTPTSSGRSTPEASSSKKCAENMGNRNQSSKGKHERVVVGNPPSHINFPQERDLMSINSRGVKGTLQGAFQNWKPIDNVSDIGYTREFHDKTCRDRERKKTMETSTTGSDSTESESEESDSNSSEEEPPNESSSKGNAEAAQDISEAKEKLEHLQFSTSKETPSAEPKAGSSGMPPRNSRIPIPDGWMSPEEMSKREQIFEPTPPQRKRVFRFANPAVFNESGSESDDMELEPGIKLNPYRSRTAPSLGSLQESKNEEPCGAFPQEIEGDEVIDTREKWLIFTCGSETYTPHQIGFKRIRPFKFKALLERGPCLKDRLAEYRRRKELEKSGIEEESIDYSDFDKVADRFDVADSFINLHGHIIGMTVSPDHRYLYVNCRPWPAGYAISDPLSPPPIAQEIDIHVIDLVTLSQVGMMRRAHRAYTPNEECFFIFLDASDHYLASGAEDKFGYLWERHYGISLTKLPHDDVVNAVAFNPTESDMLVSVSDDNTIKVWRSKRQCRALGIDYTKLPQGTKLYLKPRPSCCPGPSNSV